MSTFNYTNIQTESTNYYNDMKITGFCKDNKNDSRCRCIYPEPGISKLQINTFNPYPCWYAPCKNPLNFKTSLIREEQKKCNIVLCEVQLGEVSLDDNGVLTIRNNCLSSKNFNNVIISEELLENSLRSNYKLPNYFSRTALPFIMGLGLVLFLKL